jgi:capsular polysaccharide biosynthesis protein
VAIAEQPIVPALPVWPQGAVVLVGLATALTLGTATAFAADYMDPALRTPEEVMACLEVPVLASLPIEIDRRLSA